MKRYLVFAFIAVVFAAAEYYFLFSNIPIKNSGSQNSIETVFDFNYQVLETRGKNISIFSSPDNYLIEFNRPRIPLYSKEVQLPENASLDRVELRDSEMKTYENADVDFVPTDMHFVPENDSLKGFYPEQAFWYNVFEMLDGRKKIELIAAPLQYNNQTKQAKIYSSMKIAVYYK